MKNENTNLGLIAAVAVVAVVAFLVGMNFRQPTGDLGATVYNRQISFDEGIAVDGTERISGTGGASFTTGAFSSTLSVTGEANLDTLIQGGDVTTMTATSTAQTITAAQFCNSSLLRWDTSGSNSTATVPTAATLIADCVPTTGDTKTLLFENYGGEHVTFVSPNASTTLIEATGGDVIIEDTEWALLSVVTRTADTVVIIVTSLQDAD